MFVIFAHTTNVLYYNSHRSMPYRRLPNTDTARIRAMKTALEKGKDLPPNILAFSSKTIVNLRRFVPQFDHNLSASTVTLCLHKIKKVRTIMKH